VVTVLDDLARYLAVRDQQRLDAVSAALGAMTRRERRLVREAAVMGYVRGSMAGEAAARAGERPKIPRDSAVVFEVVDACLAMRDLYPVIGHIDRTSGGRR
jgi:hypothetical protein